MFIYVVKDDYDIYGFYTSWDKANKICALLNSYYKYAPYYVAKAYLDNTTDITDAEIEDIRADHE